MCSIVKNALVFTALLAAGSLQAQTRGTPPDAQTCIPLSEQHPDLGTHQSVSANKVFETVWGSLEMPGGACGYPSAKAHYEALLAQTRAGGGPTEHTSESLPDWGGHWGTDNRMGEVTLAGRNSTREGMAARLTPAAREIFRRDLEGWDGDAIDPLSMCLPPNFPRWITVYGYREHFLTAEKSLLGVEMMNEFRRVFTDGRTHPEEDWMTNEWLGYSIGFWENDILTIWTKGIKEGILTRWMPRTTESLEVIERWRRVDPISSDPDATDALGRIEIEITLYDPSFVEPWHTVAMFYKEDDRTDELKQQVWPHLWSCVEGSNWHMTENGVITQYGPGERPQLSDPDFWFDERYIHR